MPASFGTASDRSVNVIEHINREIQQNFLFWLDMLQNVKLHVNWLNWYSENLRIISRSSNYVLTTTTSILMNLAEYFFAIIYRFAVIQYHFIQRSFRNLIHNDRQFVERPPGK